MPPGRAGSDGAARQRQREETADRIEQAALALFGEHGFDAVTSEQIATAAGISRRTFFRYYPGGKEQVVLAHLRRVTERLPALLAARPPHESALVALRAALLELVDDEHDREPFRVRRAVMASVPAVAAQAQAEQRRVLDALEHQVALRLAADPTADLRPRLLVLTVMGAFSAAAAQWMSSDGELGPLVRRALDALAPGLDGMSARDASPIPLA